MANNQEFSQKLMQAVHEKWGYVWGLEGETYTPVMAERFRKNKRSAPDHKPETYWTQRASKWYGKRCADCSGLIIWSLRALGVLSKSTDYNSTGLIEQCKKQGYVAGGVPHVNGLLLWRKGHVGILYQKKVIEAKNTASGVVYGVSSLKNFKRWGYLPWITYEGENKVKYGYCNANTGGVNVRSKPNSNGSVVGKLDRNDPLIFLSAEADFYKIATIKNEEHLVGYMHQDFIKERM